MSLKKYNFRIVVMSMNVKNVTYIISYDEMKFMFPELEFNRKLSITPKIYLNVYFA